MGYTNPSGWVMIFSCQSFIFLTIWCKNLTAAGVLRKIFGFLYLSLKLSLTLPHKEEMLWFSYFRSFIQSTNFSRAGNFGIDKVSIVLGY